MVPLKPIPPAHCPRDVIVVGAGPVGLAIAAELARAGRDVLVLDRRPPPELDRGLRRQLLVARAADLLRLAELGLDLGDRTLVVPLAERVRVDHVGGRSSTQAIAAAEREPQPARDLHQLVAAPPVALVPIGRLQQALCARARGCGAELRYRTDAVRLRRHRRASSLVLADGSSVHAALVVVATGASRVLVGAAPSPLVQATRELFAVVVDTCASEARWVRTEVPDRGGVLRCTALVTDCESDGGTAILVEPSPGTASPPRRQLALAADAVGVHCSELSAAPQPFRSSVAAVAERVLGGDGRAPVVIAGDAAQTGHVFTGLNAFVNLALGRELCDALASARLDEALATYQRRSSLGAALLAEQSRVHLEARAPGTWALPAP